MEDSPITKFKNIPIYKNKQKILLFVTQSERKNESYTCSFTRRKKGPIIYFQQLPNKQHIHTHISWQLNVAFFLTMRHYSICVVKFSWSLRLCVCVGLEKKDHVKETVCQDFHLFRDKCNIENTMTSQLDCEFRIVRGDKQNSNWHTHTNSLTHTNTFKKEHILTGCCTNGSKWTLHSIYMASGKWRIGKFRSFRCYWINASDRTNILYIIIYIYSCKATILL